MPRVGREILVVLIRDLQDLAVDHEHVFRSAADARLRALAVRHLALTLGRLFVLRAAGAVADLAGPGLFGGERAPLRKQTAARRDGVSCRAMIALPIVKCRGRALDHSFTRTSSTAGTG